MISVAEAIQIVIDQTRVLTTELVAIQDSLGRVLARDVIADTDLPPFNRSQMDGYAVRSEETKSAPVRLRIVGESAAGKGWHHEMHEGQAVRIMTGAPVPLGADAVQQVELTHELKDNTVVEVLESVDEGRSIMNRGSEVTKGETVLRSGSILNPAMLAVLASFGCAEVEVRRRPGVSVMATGSELVTVDQVPGQDQIRDSNNYSIGAYSVRAGATVERLPLIGDNTASLKRAIEKASNRCDMIVTSGGVSMGVYDFTKTALQELGAELFFERVALRPGKPTVFGRLPNGTLVFGLPGNPVSVSVTFNLFARTSLLAMQGATEPSLKSESGVLAKSVKGNIDRESYLPAQLTTNDDGQLVVFPLKWGGSSDFVAFAAATALLNIPAGTGTVATDSLVKLVRLP
ncbi:MAG TPA: gephyrin-like molybdotransferase Glp [Pyrinomonadaceae bacterium]|jgi:molybdenum cofactor synthesis domain|nr:gephyrin-like molybdotransferase Glp [Pyrinomonadaceae bacterium]